MSAPVFSIITPTCRRPLLLKRNILSVLRQTFQQYEHIVVDDAGDQDTARVIAGFQDTRIVFQQHETARGAAASYNTGIKVSRGRFIAFLDDDDEYLPSFLEKMHVLFSQSGANTGFAWSGVSRVKDTDDGEQLLFSLIWPQRFATKEEGLVAATSIGNGFGVCVRRECLDSIGVYDESLAVCEDTDFLFRLAQKFDFETIPEVLVKIHQHGSPQLTDDRNCLARAEGRKKVLGRYRDFMLKYPAVYYAQHKAYADLCYKCHLQRKGREIMLSIIANTGFRFLNFADLFFYELSGKDTAAMYAGSALQGLVRWIQGAKQQPRSL